MKILKNILKQDLNLRTEKDYPIKGVEFIDIMPLVLQKEVYKEIIDCFVQEITSKQHKTDYILAPESRGFLLGANVASQLNCTCIPIRKKGKLPPSTIETEFDYEKEYGKDVLALPKLVNDTYEGKNFYILDDIYATGNTMQAIKREIIKLGGNIIGLGVIMNIVELNQNKDIYSMIDVEEE